ncbi:RNA polymerase III subunit C82 [Dinochytrium kinnereticum]|nr:RNA polymerase III subunit C82 [Dinochytrium kinnereticum]
MTERGFIKSIQPTDIYHNKGFNSETVNDAEASNSAPTNPLMLRLEPVVTNDNIRKETLKGHWTLYFPAFHAHFRRMALSKLAGQRLGVACEAIISAFLHPSEREVVLDPRPVSTSSLTSRIKPDQLPYFVTRSSSWIEDNIQLLLQDEPIVESYIREKFGMVSHRIWRLLYNKGKLDEKEEVPRTMDHAPARTYYLWFVSLSKCIQTMVEISHRSLMNLKLRRSKQVVEMAPLLDKSKRSDVVEDPSLLTEMERTALQKFRDQLNMMRVSELRLETALLVLKDYCIDWLKERETK